MSNYKKYKSTYLFCRSNFLMGSGSIFNVSGNYFMFKFYKTGREADAAALKNDWGVIGQDLKEVVEKTPKKELEFSK